MRTTIKRVLLLVITFVFAVVSSPPLYALDEVFTMGNDIFYYNPEDTCVSATNDISGANLAGEITIAQANIKKTANSAILEAALQKITARNPDFISLNEMHAAPRSAITPDGYALYKDPSAVGEERSTAVLWKKDNWEKLDSGRLLMVAESGPQKTDKGRSASWVTLQNTSGEIATMVSVHQMINPRYTGPDILRRQAMYKAGMEKLVEKVKDLSSKGTVFVAGDFNSRYPDNDPWGPEKMLGQLGMKSTFDDMGAVSTHKGGGTIDYIFHPSNVKTLSQSTIFPEKLSDHLFLVAKFQGAASTGDISTPLTGADNPEKAWNFFIANGLTPEQAAGIMGNIETESHFDPKASNGGNYLGIAQWSASSRWPALKKWADSKGMDPLKFDTQLRYLWKEASDNGQIKGIKKYSDVEHTAWYWGRFFEIAIINGSNSETPLTNVQDLESRTSNAKGFLKYTGQAPPITTSTATSTCGDNSKASTISPGEGDFIDKGEVSGFDTILENAKKTDSIYGSTLVNSGYCAAITARVTSGNSFGYHNNRKYGVSNVYAVSMWYEHTGDGLAHADRNPKKGSWLFYEHNDTSVSDAGHVVIYLGDNKILNDGQIIDANYPEKNWGLKYLGWIDPTEAGFPAKSLSETEIRGLLDEYR